MTKRYKTVCLFARDCGVEALKSLLDDDRFEIVSLLVHRKLPSSEDPKRGERPEYKEFEEIAKEHEIPLYTVDTKEESKQLPGMEEPFDLLLSLSWRFLVPLEVLEKARVAAINVHRGKLPEYGGAEPIKRALEKWETSIFVTAHEMVEEIDAGKVLAEIEHPVDFQQEKSLDDNIARLKNEILPLYYEAISEAVEKVER